MTEFHLDIYRVEECGFYLRDTDYPLFGGLDETIFDLQRFLQGKKITNTKTFEKGNFINQLPTYCYQLENKKFDALIITWNEIHSESGQVSSLNGDKKIGEHIEIEQSKITDGYIPGYATYFWIIKNKNLIISVRPKGMAYNGNPGFLAYMKSFLRYYSSHSIVEFPENNKPIVIGYEEKTNDMESKPVIPKFKTRLKTKPTESEFILNNVNDITKIIKKDQLFLNDTPDQNFFSSILTRLFVSNSENRVVNSTNLRIELEYQPSLIDLKEIITNFGSSGDKENDIGFKIKGYDNPIWLSSTYEKHEVNLDILKIPGGVFDGEILLTKLIQYKSNILDQIEENQVIEK